MGKRVWLMVLVTFLGCAASGARADDLVDVRVMPDYGRKVLLVEGALVEGSSRSGLGRRDRVMGMMGRWAASQTMSIETPTASQTVQVDASGTFSFHLPVSESYAATMTFVIPGGATITRTWAFPSRPNRLIVSDVDDTILVSDVKNRVKLVWRSLLRSVDKRRAVAGTPDLYRDLAGTPDAESLVFYLTSSPAFLSRFLYAFLDQHAFPPGILLTKRSLTSGAHQAHKLGWLRTLAERYPRLPMTLLGDTGEKDPEIYLEFAKEFPTRIQAVILHEAALGKRQTEVATLQQEYVKRGIPCLVWNDAASLRAALARLGMLVPVSAKGADQADKEGRAVDSQP